MGVECNVGSDVKVLELSLPVWSHDLITTTVVKVLNELRSNIKLKVKVWGIACVCDTCVTAGSYK